MNATFYVDEGGVYDLSLDGDGTIVLALAVGTSMAYTSDQHTVKVTGRLRRQRTGRGFYTLGNRAVFTLDTGEGLVDLSGVYSTRW